MVSGTWAGWLVPEDTGRVNVAGQEVVSHREQCKGSVVIYTLTNCRLFAGNRQGCWLY